jgi:hypothetical protein
VQITFTQWPAQLLSCFEHDPYALLGCALFLAQEALKNGLRSGALIAPEFGQFALAVRSQLCDQVIAPSKAASTSEGDVPGA